MVATAVLAFTLFVGATLAAPSTRIVTGTPTSTSVHPSIVQLDFFQNGVWNQACSANIITNMAVITVAGCTHTVFDQNYRPENRRIRAGADIRNTGGQLVYVQSVLVHPDYDIMINWNADISIVRLSSFLTFGNNIGFVSIMPQDYNIPDHSPVVYAGWGSENSDELFEASVFKINLDECTRRYAEGSGQIITENMICAGILDVGGEENCFRDVGGPLYYQNILTGLMSYGPCTCGDPVYPSVLTRIASYSEWIVNNANADA